VQIPVKANRVFEDIIKQIETAIASGKFKPGDKLPPERELQKTLDTSRSTLREALRVLEQKGLIEIRTGVKGGAFINATGVERMGDYLALLIRQKKVSLKHLFEFRLAIEGFVTGLAVTHATTKDHRILLSYLNEMKGLLKEGSRRWKEFYAIESLLHQFMPRMCQNPILGWILETVHSSMWSYYEMLPTDEFVLKEVYRDWHDIVDAVIEGDAVKAAGVANSHVVTYNRYLEDASRKQRYAENRKSNKPRLPNQTKTGIRYMKMKAKGDQWL
jgi:DNA-binding FadR family transcriptional regulator